MNYPLWDLPAPGLLIAFVAIVHVFVSHFAVGGGLFLVVAERKARRESDDALLAYVRRHSRFFILLTLVFGAVTGVGIWFTIGLVHPAATSSLINAFVWGWAIEWTFFFTEIAAAMVYYYGWDRLTPRQHMTVGWIYFAAAWASLLVINGILTFMLTPGQWLGNREFWSGYFNPTFWPSLVVRTLGAVGLAGVYAIFTASWMTWDGAHEPSRRKLIRWGAHGWVLPMAVLMPFALMWYFASAGAAGIPVAEIFGTASARTRDLAAVVLTTTRAAAGHPIAQNALRVAIASLVALVLLSLVAPLVRRGALRIAATLLLVAAFAAVGGAEWAREDLRKPYVIGQYMMVNGLRLPAPEGSPAVALEQSDPLSLDAVAQAGVLGTAKFVRRVEAENPTIEQEAQNGRELFRLLCSQCHTVDGYLAIRPLVAKQSAATLEALLPRLASPRHAGAAANGAAATWATPGVQLATWRNRRMPPFVGTADEKRALAVYLAQLGGGEVAPRAAAVSGEALFEANCAMCHASDGDFPIDRVMKTRDPHELYETLGKLPELNEMMPPFEGTDEERHALANYLAAVGGAK